MNEKTDIKEQPPKTDKSDGKTLSAQKRIEGGKVAVVITDAQGIEIRGRKPKKDEIVTVWPDQADRLIAAKRAKRK